MQRTKNSDNNRAAFSHIFGWMGTICLLLIITIKVIRRVEGSAAVGIFMGIAPNILGPAGLLFLFLSSSGKLSKLSLRQLCLVVASVALGLEFAQLIPRPGILERIQYTFDWLDIWASLLSVVLGYLIAHYFIVFAKRSIESS